MKAFTPDSQENAWLWLAKIISGLLIVILLGIHFVVNHLVAPEGLLSYADVVQYYKNPLVPVMEGVFLVFAVSHSLIGSRGIILDLNPPPKLIKAMDYVFTIIGTTAIIYGIWLLWVVASRQG